MRKILIILAIVVAGVMLGFIFTNSILNKKAPTNKVSLPQSQTNSQLQDPQATKLTASPSTVKSAVEFSDPTTDIENISKTKLSFSFSGDNVNISNLKIQLFYKTSIKVGFSGTDNTKFSDLNASTSEPIFDIAEDANPAEIYMYAFQPGTVIIYGEVITPQGAKIKSNDVTVVFN